MKTIFDEAVIIRTQEMCEESLDPETFAQWESVKEKLFNNRESLMNFSEVARLVAVRKCGNCDHFRGPDDCYVNLGRIHEDDDPCGLWIESARE